MLVFGRPTYFRSTLGAGLVLADEGLLGYDPDAALIEVAQASVSDMRNYSKLDSGSQPDATIHQPHHTETRLYQEWTHLHYGFWTLLFF